MSWRDSAVCRDLPPDLFFPPLFKEERTASEAQYYNLGKLACELCPVREECAREGAVEEFGLWGGRTPKERDGRRPVKSPSKILPTLAKLRVLSAMGPRPDIPSLQTLISPLLEKRGKQ